MINVLLFSHDRPELIVESIDSVFDQSYKDWVIWILDDDSSFDLEQLITRYDTSKIITVNMIRDGEAEWYEYVNLVIEQVPRGEFITYLCDDDVLSPDWFSDAMSDGDYHIIGGRVGSFGERSQDAPVGAFDIGSFLIKSDCYWDCDIYWSAGYRGEKHSYDVGYIARMLTKHRDTDIDVIDSMSMRRRYHEGSLSRGMQ